MTHRHAVSESRDFCWTRCVAYERAHSERAHGNVVTVDRCRCGATRSSESNGGTTIRGRWLMKAAGD